MRQRTVIALIAVLATLGVVLTAAAAPSRHAGTRPPARVALEGGVVDWDAQASSLTLAEPSVTGGPRALRRALRALDVVEVAIGRRTRILSEDADGVRERIAPGDLFAELDDDVDGLDAEVVALVARSTRRGSAAARSITAKRIVVYLPVSDDEGETGEDDPDPSDDLPAWDEEPLPGDGAPGLD